MSCERRAAVQMWLSALAAVLLLPAGSCLEFSIKEELPAGTVVANVKRQHFDLQGIDTAGNRFHLFQKSRPTGLLGVNATTGDIWVKGRIDREQLCPSCDTNCRIQFSVNLGHGGSSSVDVAVTVEDVNDSPPTWPTAGAAIRVQFRDGDAAGRHRDLAAAGDADCGDNAAVSYRLLNRDSPFSLGRRSSLGRLQLEAQEPMDRERRASYSMTIVAADAGQPSLSASAPLLVEVTDVNDNAPEFGRSLFSPGRPVHEDAAVGSELLRLNASDRDAGLYGSVVFDFASTPGEAQAAARRQFVVRPDGSVRLKLPLDFDAMRSKSFVFEVAARDSAADARYRLTSTATVSVQVADRIDEKPEIEVCFLPTGCSAELRQPSVRENLPPATKVAEVVVTDRDVGDEVECSIEQSGDPAFALSQRLSSGQLPLVMDLITTRSLDREQQQQQHCLRSLSPTGGGYRTLPLSFKPPPPPCSDASMCVDTKLATAGCQLQQQQLQQHKQLSPYSEASFV